MPLKEYSFMTQCRPTHLRIASIAVPLFLLLLALPFSAWALTLLDARLGTHPNKNRLVLELSSAAKFKAFTLSSPNRLVIDLPRLSATQKAKMSLPNIRIGTLGKNQTRIVLDLKSNAQILKHFALPASASNSHRLVIDYKNVPPSATTLTRHNIIKPQSKTPKATPRPAPKKAKKPIIVIDAGHGGQDPGAIGARGTFEKKVTLAVSKELKKQLESTGRYTVFLTRTNDRYIKLGRRIKIARKHHADLFISLHADSVSKKNVKGASVYTLSEKASDKQTAKLAANENKADLIADIDLSDEDEDVTNILIDLAIRDTVNQSRFLANTMVTSIKSNGIKTLKTAHRHAGFAVLKAPDTPAVLIEMGFMSNASEEKLLMKSWYRTKMAKGIRNGIDAYFKKTDANLSQ